MPILKNALKKQRVDKRRSAVNRLVRAKTKSAVKAAKVKPTKESLAAMQSLLDRAVKRGVVKKNTAARVKSRIVKAAVRAGK